MRSETVIFCQPQSDLYLSRQRAPVLRAVITDDVGRSAFGKQRRKTLCR